jgi:hypothetical protein
MLEDTFPLAAPLPRRPMINFTLGTKRAPRYKHAARHLSTRVGLAASISDFRDKPDHMAYERELRSSHGRKVAFWEEVRGLK